MESILDTIKKLIGVDVSDDSFDPDIIIDINSAIFTLSQMGIGPKNGFIVIDRTQKWSDYINSSTISLEGIKSYIHLQTKIVFDQPTNSTVIDSIRRKIQELEWRLMLAVETNNLEVQNASI